MQSVGFDIRALCLRDFRIIEKNLFFSYKRYGKKFAEFTETVSADRITQQFRDKIERGRTTTNLRLSNDITNVSELKLLNGNTASTNYRSKASHPNKQKH